MPKYDRELIARMLETPAVFEDASRREQARLLREAENLEADARSVVLEVPDGMVLVPRKLSLPMMEAGEEVLGAYDKLDDAWRAMLSAASGENGVGK